MWATVGLSLVVYFGSRRNYQWLSMILPSWYSVKNALCNISRRGNLSETLFVCRNNLPYMKHLPEDFSVFTYCQCFALDTNTQTWIPKTHTFEFKKRKLNYTKFRKRRLECTNYGVMWTVWPITHALFIKETLKRLELPERVSFEGIIELLPQTFHCQHNVRTTIPHKYANLSHHSLPPFVTDPPLKSASTFFR